LCSAHHTQFYLPDWVYLRHGRGVGSLLGNGSFISLTTADRQQLTIVIQTLVVNELLCTRGGTGVRELTRGLATLPQRWIQKPLVVRGRDGNPQEDPLAVHCFCVCSGSALLRDLLGVSRSGNVIFCLSCQFIPGFSCMYSLCIVS